MVICAELPRNNSFWQVEAAIVAAYQAAARDISAGDCSYVKDCERLLPASLNVTLQTIQGKKYSRRDSAYVAMACNRAGGHLSLMGSLSLPETMVPINQVNNIVTGTSILAAPSYLESGYFRCGFSHFVSVLLCLSCMHVLTGPAGSVHMSIWLQPMSEHQRPVLHHHAIAFTAITFIVIHFQNCCCRTHPPAKVVAEDLAKLASLFEWEKMILLYSPGTS